MGTYARWQLVLGKTFMAAYATHDGAEAAAPQREAMSLSSAA
jgi:hypothetical protein